MRHGARAGETRRLIDAVTDLHWPRGRARAGAGAAYMYRSYARACVRTRGFEHRAAGQLLLRELRAGLAQWR